jgi:polyhydroxybutyrate depolymerase
MIKMKKLLLLLFFLPIVLQAQTTRNVTFDGVSRLYIEYIPSSYDGSTAYPLVFSFHGLGDNAANFSGVGFQQLSETEDFIVVTPQALNANILGFDFGNAWNSGAGVIVLGTPFTLNSDVKDLEFVSFLIDSMANHYNIDLNRVYATGFSMGGFMSHRLACELNDKIAAIGTVAGTIGTGITCNPGRAVPMMHLHGTADATIGYETNNFGSNAQSTVDFWANNNGCNASPSSTNWPNTVPGDGITLTKYVYNNCDAEVEFFKATGAGHSWLSTPSNDISYTREIWDFLSRQSLEGACAVTVDLGSDIVLADGASAVLDATTEGATYLWNTGATSATITVDEGGNYSVTVTVGGCQATDDVNVELSTRIFNNYSGFEFGVYPNPINGVGAIELFAEKSTFLQISIIDLIGREVFTTQTTTVIGSNRIPLTLQNLSKGTYLLTLDMDGKRASKSIIVQ